MTKPHSGRALALKALVAIERQGAYANRILNTLFAQSESTAQDRAMATEIVYGTLRHMTLIDHLLSQLLTKKLVALPTEVRNILRQALYELLTTTETDYAVVNEAVNLVRKSKFAGLSGLVNAVLRGYLRNKADLILPDFAEEPLAHLTICHSHPRWLVERWIRRWGTEETHRLLAVNNLPAPFTLRTNTLLLSRAELLKQLAGLAFDASPSPLLPEAVRLATGRSLTSTPLWAAGYFYIQDEGSMLIAHLLAPKPGETISDLCAAPGGKTTHLAQLMGDTGLIYALDLYPHKTRLIQENASRLGITIIEPLTIDARSWQPENLLDAVLLDAPCTGTGVLRRRPDIRWRRRPKDLKALTKLQEELLEQAASLVKPGGRIVYSTCSLEPEENEERIKSFLRSHPQFQVSIPESFAQHLQHQRLPEGIILLPQQDGPDGFFMTKLVKNN
ncbi:MAG: 16S rRNA (cytosine(967)-C(5))-methyltransferase RsmB [Firmicutes bacterium]|nr:16S rRNA (cytosine(967)-C(5))-methyltransferase RsmB [Bacillota bacterium]